VGGASGKTKKGESGADTPCLVGKGRRELLEKNQGGKVKSHEGGGDLGVENEWQKRIINSTSGPLGDNRSWDDKDLVLGGKAGGGKNGEGGKESGGAKPCSFKDK